MFDSKRNEFRLEHLDGADVAQSRRHGSSEGRTQRATSTLNLVFNNTRPATHVPLTGWAVSGGGAGMLANAINDWLRAHHERAAANPQGQRGSGSQADSPSSDSVTEPANL